MHCEGEIMIMQQEVEEMVEEIEKYSVFAVKLVQKFFVRFFHSFPTNIPLRLQEYLSESALFE